MYENNEATVQKSSPTTDSSPLSSALDAQENCLNNLDAVLDRLQSKVAPLVNSLRGYPKEGEEPVNSTANSTVISNIYGFNSRILKATAEIENLIATLEI